MVTRAGLAIALALLAAPGLAQSTDPVFTGWTWTPDVLVSEATGLGGAFVATTRSGEALFWSPAGMTFDSGLDIRVGFGARPGFGLVRHGDKFHIGVGVRRTFSRTLHGGGSSPSGDVFEVGQLRVTVDQAAVGVGLRTGRLRLGATVAAGPMRAVGAWSRVKPTLDPATVTETRYDYQDVREWQLGGTSSVLLELLQTHPMARNQARIGAAVSWPALVRTPRYRRSRLVLRAAEPGATPAAPPSPLVPFETSGPDLQSFRLPMSVSLGGEWRFSVLSMFRSVRLAVGADWTDYEGVLDTVRDNRADPAVPLGFDTERPWTFGGGVEVVHPLLRMRVGMRERAGHRLLAATPGPPPPQRARTTFGASRDAVIAGKRLAVDIDTTSAFDDLVLSMRVLW